MWQIDSSAANPINFPVRQWHGGLFKEVKAAGLQITASFSMELVNPPDDDGLAAVLFYTIVYTFTNLGAFGVVLALRRRGEEC